MLYSISKIIVKKKIVLGQSFLWTKPQQLYITLNVIALSQDVRVRQCDSNHTDISPEMGVMGTSRLAENTPVTLLRPTAL